jgi:hypothetical protein
MVDDVGRSPAPQGRACGPSDLSRCASQPEALVPNAVRACPFCNGSAFVTKMFPTFETPWFVLVDHAEDCEIGAADGYRQCHASEEAALKSWNGVPQ